MARLKLVRWSGVAAVIGGIWWVAMTLVSFRHDFWSAAIGPLTYENWNRLQIIPLLLMFWGWTGVQARARYGRSRVTRGAAGLVSLALLLLVAGNVVEFWLVLLQSHYVPLRLSYQAGGAAWPGAQVGWGMFLLGLLLLLGGMLLLGFVNLRDKILARWNTLPLLIALSVTIIAGVGLVMRLEIAFSLLLVAIGLGWSLLGYALMREGEASILVEPMVGDSSGNRDVRIARGTIVQE